MIRILKEIHFLTAFVLWSGVAVAEADHSSPGSADENRDEWLLIESPPPEPEMEPWRKELIRKLQEPMSTEEPQKRDLSEAEMRAARERKTSQNAARDLVEKEAIRLKAPTGFAGVKWLMSPEEVKSIRPRVRVQADGELFEAMEWLGRPAAVTYMFNDGLFVEAVVVFSGATEADFNKTQVYLQNAYGKMPEPGKTEKHLLSSTYKEGRFSILHLLWPNKMEGVTFFRTE